MQLRMSDVIDLTIFAAKREERRAAHGVGFTPRHDPVPARREPQKVESLDQFLAKRKAGMERDALEKARQARIDVWKQQAAELDEQATQDMAAVERNRLTLKFNTARLRQIHSRQQLIGINDFIALCWGINAVGQLTRMAAWVLMRFVPAQHKNMPFSDPDALAQKPLMRLIGGQDYIETQKPREPRNLRLKAYHAVNGLADRLIDGSRDLMRREADKAETHRADQYDHRGARKAYVMLINDRIRRPSYEGRPTMASAVVFKPLSPFRKAQLATKAKLNKMFAMNGAFAFG